MLATLHYRQKDLAKMDAVFEDAARYSKKQPMTPSKMPQNNESRLNTEKSSGPLGLAFCRCVKW